MADHLFRSSTESVKTASPQGDPEREQASNIEKESKPLEKQLFHLQAQRFSSQEEALKVFKAIASTIRYHGLDTQHWTEHKRYAKSGRPGPETPVKAIEWQIQVGFQVDDSALEARIEHGACLIIGTNTRVNELSDEAVFSAYKGQNSAEQGFRFLKDPLFFVSSLYVKKPSRIEGLLMVMTLALFVYSLAQRRMRSALSEAGEHLPNQIKQPTSRPTLRWIFQMLDGINRVVVRSKEGVSALIEGLTELKTKILRLFGPCVEQIYQISSA